MKFLIGSLLGMGLYGLFSSVYALGLFSLGLACFTYWADRSMANKQRDNDGMMLEDLMASDPDLGTSGNTKPNPPA